MNINFIINLLSAVGGGFIGGAIAGAVYELDWQTAISISEVFQHLVILGLGLVLWGLSALLTLLGEVQRSASKAAYWLEIGFAK